MILKFKFDFKHLENLGAFFMSILGGKILANRIKGIIVEIGWYYQITDGSKTSRGKCQNTSYSFTNFLYCICICNDSMPCKIFKKIDKIMLHL